MWAGMSGSQSAGGAGDGNKPMRRRGSQCCQVEGCMADLHTQAKPAYCLKRRLCHEHIKADAVQRKDSGPALWRYCFQCGKLEPLALFDGTRRNCRASLQQRRRAARAKTGKAGATMSQSQDEPLLQSPQSSASDITLVQRQHPGAVQASSCINLAGLLPGNGATCTSPASCNTAEDGLFDIQAAAAELAAAYCGAVDSPLLEFSGQQLQMAQAQAQEQARLCQMLQVELAAAGQLPDTQDIPTPAAVFASLSPSMMAVPANASFGPASTAGMVAGNVPAAPQAAAVGMPQHGAAFFDRLLDQLLGEINTPTQPLACATPHQLRAPQVMALPAVGIAPRRDPSAAQAHVLSRIAMLEQQCQELAGTLQALQVMAQQGLL